MATGVINSWGSSGLYFNGGYDVSAKRKDNGSKYATVTIEIGVNCTFSDDFFYHLYLNGNPTNVYSAPPHYEADEPAGVINHTYDVAIPDTAGKFKVAFSVNVEGGEEFEEMSETIEVWVDYAERTAFEVTYNADGGTGAPAKQTKYKGINLKLATTAPVKPGYSFAGWAKYKGGPVVYRGGENYTGNEDLFLTAVWTANPEYTVNYFANGGVGAPASQQALGGVSLKVSATRPTKDSLSGTYTVTFDKVEPDAVLDGETTVSYLRTANYTFSRWNTKADGSGTDYLPDQSFTLSGNLNLYAIWTENIVGSVTLPTATLEQQKLLGWSLSTSDIHLINSPYSPASDVTLYAIWAPNGDGGYIKIPAESDLGFTVGQKLRLVGFKDAENDGIYTVKSSSFADGIQTMAFEEDFAISGSQNTGLYSLDIYGEGSFVPDMDFICASNNRLWGCSSKKRTIYASALGDPTDFWTFAGDSLDAFQVAVGSAGDFTGCIALNSTILFFKQHTIHRMLGSYPAEYTLYTYSTEGVSESNGLSVIDYNNTAVYVSEHGISSYSGSSAGIFSKELGEGNMVNSIGNLNGGEYQLFYKDKQGNDHTYILDLVHGLWVEKDYGEVLSFAHLGDGDYVLVNDNDVNQIFRTDTGVDTDDDWEIVYKPYYEADYGSFGSKSHLFEKKRYTGITLRLELPEGSWMKAEFKADNLPWHKCLRLEGRKEKVMDYVVRTPRCDKLQLKLSGHGPMTILAMEREFLIGSRR